MRISRTSWLAAAAASSLGGVAAAGNTQIQFNITDFQNPDANDAAVFVATAQTLSSAGPVRAMKKTFHWSLLGYATVREVRFMAYTPEDKALEIDTISLGALSAKPPGMLPSTSTIFELPQETHASGSGPGNAAGGSGLSVDASIDHNTDISILRLRDKNVIQAQVTSRTTGSVTIDDITALIVPPFVGNRMYFQLLWNEGTGSSFSRFFTVTNDTDVQKLENAPAFSASNAEPAFAEGSTGPTATVAEGPAQSTQTGGPSSSQSGNGTDSSSPLAGGSGSRKGGGGLSKGTVAGIAVGAGVGGVLVIGGLVWIIIRNFKRRRQRGPTGQDDGGVFSYGRRNRTQEILAEKEANTGVVVSPHSPHSEDGGGNFSSTPPGPRSGVPPQSLPPHQPTLPAVLTSYQELSSSAGALGQRFSHNEEQGQPTTSTPATVPGEDRATSALGTPYSHLVEEGMTEEDIRRLEEEERQLDQAIEQASRR
ncbi:hypothetical protein VTK73DRAFT_6684 [Phialemonium thermophilum]|uniref:Mid2 domain-containing protein n=1 Tax=Phialemonium thermophilum TaxID=223376 RepID=A0ABR3WII5_9PEZI